MDIGAHQREIPLQDVPTPGLPAAVFHEGEWWWAVKKIPSVYKDDDRDLYLIEENPLMGKRSKIIAIEPSALI